MPAAGEDLLPRVEGGQLLFEEDVPAFGEAEPALFGGGVVSTGRCQDGPCDLVGDPLVLELPYVCTLKIKLTPTWKIHALVYHLKPFLEEKKCGLGVFCEQCSEAAHAVMKPTMQRFKRRSDHRHHDSKLKRGTTDYTAVNWK